MLLWTKRIAGRTIFWGIHSDDVPVPPEVTTYPAYENINPFDIETPLIWKEVMRAYPTINDSLIELVKSKSQTINVVGDIYVDLTHSCDIEVRKSWRRSTVSSSAYKWLSVVFPCFIGVSNRAHTVTTPTGIDGCSEIMYHLFNEWFNACPICGIVRNYIGDGPCDTCIRTHGQCASCGEYLPLSELENTRRGFLCCDCNVVCRDDVVDGYGHTRGDLPFYPEKMPKARYYGVEFEFSGDCSNSTLWDSIDKFTRVNKYGEAKEDGSLSGDGFELVTFPATYKHLKSDVFGLEALLKKVNAAGFRRISETGMHVHVSRASLCDEAVDKLTAILNNCQHEIVTISDRGCVSSWSKFDYDRARCCKDYALDKCHEKNDSDDDRYHALNVTNSQTIEFRFFRGTKSFDKFIRRLTFIDCLLHYIDTHTFSECFDVATLTEVAKDKPEVLAYLAEYDIE